MAVRDNKDKDWIFIAVYGSPSLHLRRGLWNDLNQEKLHIRGPWMIAGDFNAILNTEETSNQNASGNYRNDDFRNWMFNEGLVDLGYIGQTFTWKRGNDQTTFKGARLDRAICSLDLLETFHNTKVTHLAANSSDHCPIKICIDETQRSYQTPFRFQGAWTSHAGFLDCIRNAWNVKTDVWSNRENMAAKLKVWNRDVFRNIHSLKRTWKKNLKVSKEDWTKDSKWA
ncbi:PREDICTED: uncharacterized protein LOC109166674 [Ipomoea nil]|uniref:uncharacterized protein LOC109166674 n=1 Tax=Ipomoea nil TaxID=35883 RepID=UPI0009016327|nr:PREDICTED: uncharacterized protein LOC109166674 [Ipomoea nil]